MQKFQLHTRAAMSLGYKKKNTKCLEQKISTYGKWKLNMCSTFVFLTYTIGTVHAAEQEANVLRMHRTEM